LKKLYLILLFFLVVEFFLRAFNFNEIFLPISTIAHPENAVQLYKFYGDASLFIKVGLTDMSALQSLLLGSQSASMIGLVSLFIFGDFINSRFKKKNNRYIFIFLLIIYPFIATGTSNVCLLMTVILLIFIFPNSNIKNNKSKLFFFLSFTLFGSQIIRLLLYRIDSLEVLEYYFNEFYLPIDFFLKSNLGQILFGRNINDFSELNADFGFGIILVNNGLLIILFLIAALFTLYKYVLEDIKLNTKGIIREEWIFLATINLICSIIWIFSLIHYTTALQTGGRHLLAFHLALVLVSVKKCKDSKSYNQLQSSANS